MIWIGKEWQYGGKIYDDEYWVEIRPATTDLLQKFYGRLPKTSQRAIVVMLNDRVVVVTGFYVETARMVLFSDISDDVRPLMATFWGRRTIMRVIRRLGQMAEASNLPVDALADPNIHGSCELLEHMGFRPVMERIYSWGR